MRCFLILLLCLLAGPASAQSKKVASKPAKPAPAAPGKPYVPPPAKVEWRPVYYKGRAGVPADQVAACYDLRVPEVWQKSFTTNGVQK